MDLVQRIRVPHIECVGHDVGVEGELLRRCGAGPEEPRSGVPSDTLRDSRDLPKGRVTLPRLRPQAPERPVGHVVRPQN